jgi:hypothetical protein
MKRLAAVLTTAIAAAAVLASPAPAATLSYATAKGGADYFARQSAAYYGSNSWAGSCPRRETPWRYSCRIDVWVPSVRGAWHGSRYFDVVSPFIGTRVRAERWTPWVWRH